MSSAVATENVWKLLSTRLRSFIRARVEDDQAASDLLQETFLRIHQNLHTLGDDERLEAWVFRIARNMIVDHYRSRRRTSPGDLEGGLSPQVESSNINEMVSDWIPSAMESLPEPYRKAVRLYEVQGLPQKDIARRLGLSLPGAKSRIQRGREKLKQVLDDCCSFELDRRGNVLGWQARGGAECASCSEPTSSEKIQAMSDITIPPRTGS